MKHLRFVFSQAMRVEPEPPKTSAIFILSFPQRSKNHSARATGFCVGCCLLSFSTEYKPTCKTLAISLLCFSFDQQSSKHDPGTLSKLVSVPFGVLLSQTTQLPPSGIDFL